MKIASVQSWIHSEPHAHVMMRHAKEILRLFLIAALIATIVLFVFFRPAAHLAALTVPFLFLAFVLASYLQAQATIPRLRERGQESISSEEVEMNIQYAGVYIAMALTLLFATSTLIVAASMVDDWSMVGLSASILFLLATLFMLPYIPLFLQGARQDERDKLDREAKLDGTPEEGDVKRPLEL